jgi:hypothetical protein
VGRAFASVAMGPGQGLHRGPGQSTLRCRSVRIELRDQRKPGPGAGRVRPCGRSRQVKKQEIRVVCGMPGGITGPSLGEPCVEGPTTRHRDELGPERRGMTILRKTPSRGFAGKPARLRYRVDIDVPVLERARPSGRPGSANGGDRDHRGWPLLLGVGMNYQISYRNSSPRPSVFLKDVREDFRAVMVRFLQPGSSTPTSSKDHS